jgi:hypothetical protein
MPQSDKDGSAPAPNDPTLLLSVLSCIENGLSQPTWIGKAQLMTAGRLDQTKRFCHASRWAAGNAW